MKLNMGGKHYLKPLCPLLLLPVLFSSCSSMPGDGGTSTITGRVHVTEYNSSGIPFNDYYVADQNVYLIYGDGTIEDDNTKTGYDGAYNFQFLRKGDYKVYVYSDCYTCDGFTQAIVADVTVSKNHEDVTVADINIEKH